MVKEQNNVSLAHSILRTYDRQVKVHEDAIGWRNGRTAVLSSLLSRMHNQHAPFQSIDEVEALLGTIGSQEIMPSDLGAEDALYHANYLWRQKEFRPRQAQIKNDLSLHLDKLSAMNGVSRKKIEDIRQRSSALRQTIPENKLATRSFPQSADVIARVTSFIRKFKRKE